MNENDKALLNDMLDYARRTYRRVVGQKPEDLIAEDFLLGDAILRSIEIFGEAASHISSECRQQYPEIAWPQIIGMRNRLIHGYTDVNWTVVLDTATQNIPVLIRQLELILGEES
jgi:uncharacterized protein with HEPN domain